MHFRGSWTSFALFEGDKRESPMIDRDSQPLTAIEARELVTEVFLQIDRLATHNKLLEQKVDRLTASIQECREIDTISSRGPLGKRERAVAAFDAAIGQMASQNRSTQLDDVLLEAGVSKRSHSRYRQQSERYEQTFQEFERLRRQITAERIEALTASAAAFYNGDETYEQG